MEIESTNLNFLTARLVLLPQAKTETEQDPAEKETFVKWLYGLTGETTCVVMTENGTERHTIRKNESFSFRSTYPHYFENNTGKKAVCILVQNPNIFNYTFGENLPRALSFSSTFARTTFRE